MHATALPMPDSIIDKVHRMARQQKNNPGLIFADRNLNLDEYKDDDDDDDGTYYGNGNDDKEDEEVLDYDEEEDNDTSDNGMAAHGPPMADDEEEDNDDDDDRMAAHGPPMVDAPLPDNLAQPLDNPPGEIPGVEQLLKLESMMWPWNQKSQEWGKKRLNRKSQSGWRKL